jgi:hypothetical protein
MVDANFVLNLVNTAGILAGVYIAINELRKGREERRNQFSQTGLNAFSSPGFMESWVSFLRNMDFSTYEEWGEKYGPYTNPEAAKHWYTLTGHFSMMGLMVMNGQLDLETVLIYVDPNMPFMLWEKSLPIFKAWRERFNNPDMQKGFEYLVNELKKNYPNHTAIPNPSRQRLMQQQS